MNISSLAGLILGFGMFIVGVLTSGGVQMFGNFWDVPSLFITIGGSLAGVMMSNQMPDFINGLKGFKLIFKNETADTGEVIRNIINLSNIARKEGLLALEEAASDIEDDFLKKGIMLVVDGTDPELVRGILETDLDRFKLYRGPAQRSYQCLGKMGRVRSCLGYDRYLGWSDQHVTENG